MTLESNEHTHKTKTAAKVSGFLAKTNCNVVSAN